MESRSDTVKKIWSKFLTFLIISKKKTIEVSRKNPIHNVDDAILNIEDSLESLRYNNIVIATDADVDGMHIRLLLITFFLQFFPELIKEGHLYILQTPLFRAVSYTHLTLPTKRIV